MQNIQENNFSSLVKLNAPIKRWRVTKCIRNLNSEKHIFTVRENTDKGQRWKDNLSL